MRDFVRSLIISASVLVGMLATIPSVAHATRVNVVRIQAINVDDDVMAFELTNALHAEASQVAGWSVSIASSTLPQLLLSNGCSGDVPDMACLIRIANTSGSGAYGPIMIYGFLHRIGEGEARRYELELTLFDVVSGLDPRHLTAHLTAAQAADPDERHRLAQTWVVSLTTGVSMSDRPPLDEDETELPASGGSRRAPPSDPNTPLEIAGWSLIGLAGASAIAAIVTGSLVLGMNGDPRFDAYRASWEAGSGNVCDFARSDPSTDAEYVRNRCSEAETYEITTPVLWTIAALAGIGGIALVWHPWTSSGSSEVSVSLLPLIGRDRGGGSLTINF